MELMGDANRLTREYFDSILLETRYIDSDLPDTGVEIFGRHYKTPIMTAALSHLHKICPNAMAEYAAGAKEAGALCFVGMGEDADLEAMTETGADVVKIIKPHKDNAEVFRKIEHAKQHGAIAVGMDIDHAYTGDGHYDNVFGLPMKPKSFEEMKAFAKASELPFVVKGVLSVSDACKSVELGAAAIIVSHHHGIMPYSVPPLMVLPEIVAAVNRKIKVLVDCGIESGADVFKALALGADGVCVGRKLMDPLKNQRKGVAEEIERLTGELASIMARTGSKTTKTIDPSVLHIRKW